MRLFIAIDINEEVRKSLGDLQQQLQSKVDIKKSDVKWVDPDRVHLTLKFLGEVKDQRTVELFGAVKTVADRHKRFELDIESVGYFGARSAKVLWVGTGRGKDSLCRLQKDLAKELASVGWPEEPRQFAGHLTVCRIRNTKAGIKLAALSEDYRDFWAGSIEADSVSVYQSQLRPAGPVYTRLAEYKMRED